jgi:hypothetical protein
MSIPPGEALAKATTSATVFTGTVIERQVGIERGIHREGRGVVQNRVAVRRGPRHHGFADGAARAAAIFDDELLAEIGAELREQDARGGVGAAGRRIGHHDPHRPVRPCGLRRRAAGKGRRRHAGQKRASCDIGPRHRSLHGFDKL